MDASTGLVESLSQVIQNLAQNPYPHLHNPPGCKKRASVALVLRVRPSPTDSIDIATSQSNANSATPSSQPQNLQEFFAQRWVQDGDAEVLFIKRAGRAGDRWSGHVAFPGGKRDPLDVDDRAAAIRETREEVGLDLTSADCLFAGNLPERVITIRGQKTELMALCSFVFVLTTPQSPSLLLQPTEVAATHWVSLRCLLSPSVRTRELVSLSSRFGKQDGPVVRTVLRATLGKMMFAAIHLIPSESMFASSIPDFIPALSKRSSTVFGLVRDTFGSHPSTSTPRPLLLWGLTLGILCDLLEKLPPHNAVGIWHYPTFTTPDLRFLVYLFTYRLRKNNAQFLNAGSWPNQTAVDLSTAAVAVSETELQRTRPSDVGAAGIDNSIDRRSHDPSQMLSGYYDRVNVAIAAFLVMRLSALGWLGYFSWSMRKRWRR